ncbi:MAG: phosphodiester glycosidase family protein [Nanoarchaeota archaeon]|nr:phosphodiester glycosidase family protein [Nanoarchaeota archaeon]
MDRGLNPALVINSLGENCKIDDLIKKLGSTYSASLAEKYLRLYKKNNPPEHSRLLDKLFLRRPYRIGINKLAYFSKARSLLNSISFDKEEQITRKMFFDYAKDSIKNMKPHNNYESDAILYNALDSIFSLKSNKILDAVSDCSFIYRHRSRQDLIYMNFTEIELKGIVNQIIDELYGPKEKNKLMEDYQEKLLKIAPDYKSLIKNLTTNSPLKIDDSIKIINNLQDVTIPLFCFLDGSSLESLVLSVLNPIKNRIKKRSISAPIYVFSSKKKRFNESVDHEFIDFIIKNNSFLKKGIKLGLLKIIKTDQVTGGVNLFQIEEKYLNVLNKHGKNGLICSFDEEGLITSSSLNLGWISIGNIKSESLAAISGLKIGDGYAIRHTTTGPPFVGFPIVNKSILDLHDKSLYSENNFNILDDGIKKEIIEDENRDGSPISGVFTIISNIKKKYNLDICFFPKASSLQKIIKKKNLKNNKNVILGWNGGYFLDDRTINSRKFPNILLNSPLGLLKIRQKLISLPLFNNRPALAIDLKGRLKIERLNFKKIALSIKFGKINYSLKSDQINPLKLDKSKIILNTVEKPIQKIPKGFIAIKFLFNRVIEILEENQISNILNPTYTLLVPTKDYSDSVSMNSKISFIIDNYNKFYSMMEAGPLLINHGKISINLKKEKWDTDESKAFQFAEIDSTEVRTARTAVCTLKNNKMAILIINSRSVESVGATHFELAKIIKKRFKNNVLDALELDSGGSVCFWAHNHLLSIGSTINSANKNINNLKYSPRPISTAILISTK